jgi:hypothetical protein
VILSTSDIRIKRKKAYKAAIIYLAITLFCGLFSLIYEYFSHGVYSNYMIYLFLFPLIGGVLPFIAVGIINKLNFPRTLSLNLYNSGIASLTVGSCLQGVLEIYGTTSYYMPVYWVAGMFFIASGIIIYLFSMKKSL